MPRSADNRHSGQADNRHSGRAGSRGSGQAASHSPADSRRRGLVQRLVLAAATLAWPWARVAAQGAAPGPAKAAPPLRPTPAQTEGPYYPINLPADTDFDLLRQGGQAYAKGQPGWLDGQVRDTSGAPLAGAVVEIWQCDADGHYRHPGDGDRADPAFQAFGRVATDADGRYRFRTIRPVAYSGRTPHIHVKVKQGRRTLLTTQVYAAGDPGNARDFLWRQMSEVDRAAVTVAFVAVGEGWRAVFDVVVAG